MPVRLLDQRGHRRGGHLRRAVALIAADVLGEGRVELDEVDVVAQILAHRLARLVRPVGHRARSGQAEVRREDLLAVHVAGGGSEPESAGPDARPGHVAARDRIAEGDVGVIAAGRVAHGGEARLQVARGIAQAVQRDRGDRIEEIAYAERGVPRHAAAQQVDVGVDQAGEERALRQVEDLIVFARDRPRTAMDLGDALPLDHDLCRARGVAAPVE